MGNLYRQDLNKYSKYFDESARLLGIDVKYQYIIKRNTESQSGESIYSNLSEPITQSVIIEQGNPKVDSLKQLGWFMDDSKEQILVDFSNQTPNLQEGCQFTIVSNRNSEQEKTYKILKLSSEVLFPNHIKCLCEPVMFNETTYIDKNNIQYGQQAITADDENYSFINSDAEISFF